MNEPDVVATLRRANPVFTLVVGVVIGALLVAISHDPRPGTDEALAGVRSAGSGGGVSAGSAGAVDAAPTDAGAPAAAETGGPGSGGGTGAAPATARPMNGGATNGDVGAGASPGATTTTGCAGAFPKGVQGVTDKAVKIGFALPDLGVLAAAVPIGDQRAHVEAILAGMRKAKLLPVCGRDIAPVYRKYDVLDPAQSRAACVGFGDEDRVFGVVSLFGFSGAECVTVEKRLVLLDSGDALRESQYQASPLLFSENPPIDPSMRAMAYWAIRSGVLNGKKIGVYYNTHGPGGTTPPGDIVKRELIDVLTRAGHKPEVVVASDTSLSAANVSQGDPNDSVAVQRFKAAGVQVVFPMNWVSNFFRQAELQGFKAQWIGYGVAMVSDATTNTFPPNTFDGALGLAFAHTGEDASNAPLTAQQKTCLGYWTAAGNRDLRRDDTEAMTIREACDPIDLIVRALRVAGNELTHARFVASMETIRDVPMAYYADQTFGPGKHYGAGTNVPQRWSAGCTCWRLAGPWSPLYTR
jgi:hypothetical protein